MKWWLVMATTFFRVPAAALILYFGLLGMWHYVLIIALLGFFSDYVDGQLARRWKVVSEAGMLLDPLTDKVVCLSLLGLLAGTNYPWLWPVFVIFAVYDLMTTMLRLVLARFIPMPAHRTAKIKTASLMIGLVVMTLSVMFSGLPATVLTIVGTATLVLSACLTAVSLFQYISWLRRMRLSDWLQLKNSVLDIDFTAWHKKGVRAVLFDVEGTLTEYGGSSVEKDIRDCIAAARKAGIKHIALITNMPWRERERAEAVAGSIGADIWLVPRELRERKPNPTLARKALKQFGVGPKDCAFVGDKVADVLAGYLTGVQKVAWVERYGTADHILDRIAYRRIEVHLRKFFNNNL